MKLVENHIEMLNVFVFLAVFLAACNKDQFSETTPIPTSTSEQLPAAFEAFYNVEDIYTSGDYVVIQTKGTPDHGSPYYPQSDTRYEDYNGNNPAFHLNPNRIQEQSLTFRIPKNPEASTNPRATALGPIGVAINGVAIYNQYAGPNQPLTREINSFDQYNGHPQQTGMYHYHIEPLHLTNTNGKESLVGFLLDGFPVYGPIENGNRVTNEDLDIYHGHFGKTEDYPEGIYHYHITSEDPYINGNGYFGNPGTVSR